MLAFVYNIIILTAEVAHNGGGFTEFYNKYFNYPGFEAWKFLNLAIFIAVIVYLVKKPLSEAFKAKRESIRAELIKAEQEKQAALETLAAAEAKLASLDVEKKSIIERAKAEAGAERARLEEQTAAEISKMQEQNSGELTRLSQLTRIELRRFSAQESIRLAEEKLKSKINPENDAELVKSGIAAIGGMN